MPNYSQSSAANPIKAVYPGSTHKLFDAETVTAPQASEAVAIPPSRTGGVVGVDISWIFSTPPAASLSMDVQIAEFDNDASYFTIDTISTLAGGVNSYSGYSSKFWRVKVTTLTGGGTLTVAIKH
jgi:hypothetical protein